MFILGHIGITLGAIYLLLLTLSHLKKNSAPYVHLIEELDFRLAAIMAVLPDVIDKIVGMAILKDEIANGRIFSHSILGLAIISLCLFLVVKMKLDKIVKTVFLILPLWFHLLLDRMWENLHTLFWPALGFSFPKLDVEFADYFSILVSEPYIYGGEILGAAVIFALLIRYKLLAPRRLISFIKSGTLDA